MKLSKDLREFVTLFNANEVRYLLAGGTCGGVPRPSEVHGGH